MTIEIRIDELILRGFAPLDRARLRAALERELARLIEEGGLPGSGEPGEFIAAAHRPPLKERATLTKPAEAGCDGGCERDAIRLNPAEVVTPAVRAAPDRLPPGPAARFSGLRPGSPLLQGRASDGPLVYGRAALRGSRNPRVANAIAIAPSTTPGQLAARAAAALYDAIAAHPSLRGLIDANVSLSHPAQAPLPSRGGAGGEVP